MISTKTLLKKIFNYTFSLFKFDNPVILGIETSCDDTACAVVSGRRNILGEYAISQQEVVLRHGGIMPTIARDLHEMNIRTVVETTLQNAKMTMQDIDAIAVTTRPGLAMCLLVGTNYAKELSKKYKKPLLPIHHMEAHAHVAKLVHKEIGYPFLTFLISGGHCLIAVVHSVDKFSLLGKSIDDAPGEAFDKIARRLKVNNLTKYRLWSGGAAIEDLAKEGNSLAFSIPQPLLHYANCNFSFAGLKSNMLRLISTEEEKYGTAGDDVLPNVSDICASFQYGITKHLCVRLQRAMEFVSLRKLLPNDNSLLVVSGGAASNNYFRRAFEIVCHEMGYKLYIPPPKLCTDNGIMIAWNGVERYRANIGVCNYDDLDSVLIDAQCPLGKDITQEVLNNEIKCKWIKLNELHTTSTKNAS